MKANTSCSKDMPHMTVSRKGDLSRRWCKCINPPKNSLLEKDSIYRWEYGIDCYYAYHESGAY